MKVTFDEKALRYRAVSGRFIKRSAITDALESVRTESRGRVKAISTALAEGRINLAQWQISMREEIKAMHLLSAGIARGGKAQLSPAELGRIGAETRKQYEYLANFARQIESGAQPLNGRFLQRAGLYVDASRATFSNTERRMMQGAGFTEERNVLHAKESCAECAAEAGKGWVKAGSISAIGTRICRVNCLCSIQSRRAA